MLSRVALVRTDVSEELSASFIRVTIIGELGTTLAVTSNLPEDTILHSHRRKNLKSYEATIVSFQFLLKSPTATLRYITALIDNINMPRK
jgi:hypothetical protein